MILVLSDLWLPFPGGAERYMFNLARYLQWSGHDVTVLTGYEYPQSFDGPAVTSKPIGILETHADGWAMVREAIEYFAPDVILVHHLYAYEFHAELLATGIPIVQVVHAARRLDSVAFAVFTSEWSRRKTTSLPDDMTITPPALVDVVAPTHGDAIGFIKPIVHKGVKLFYEVAARCPDRHFVVLRGEWQDLEVIRPAPNITFIEPVDDIRTFWSMCRLVLMPSTGETAGTVGQEAALNGVPCISSNVDGLPETNGGVCLPPYDIDAWVRTITELDDPARYAAVVRQQEDFILRTDHAGHMKRFAERIAALIKE